MEKVGATPQQVFRVRQISGAIRSRYENITNQGNMKELTLIESISALDTLENQVMEQEDHKAYLIGNYFSHLGDRIQKAKKDGFRKYVDEFKEVPGGFEVNVRAGRKMYAFEQDMEWSMINKKLKDREEFLKMVSDIEAKGGVYVDAETGEIHQGVKITYASDSYAITKK